MARLFEKYKTEVLPELMRRFELNNALATPRIIKISVNVGAGRAKDEKRLLGQAISDLTTITGMKPVVTKARKSIAGFKLRQGMNVGAKVTLRGKMMYEFLDRLVSIVLPRVRDFRGLSPKAFDGNGNYTLGLTDQSVFPEIKPDDIEFQQGMNITICISGRSDEKSAELLRLMGMPLKTD